MSKEKIYRNIWGRINGIIILGAILEKDLKIKSMFSCELFDGGFNPSK